MASLFSLPEYPGAVSYSIQYSDPVSGNPNQPNRFGPWNDLGTGTITAPSNILDTAGSQNLRLYRAAPTIAVNGTNYTFPYYEPFAVGMSEPGVYQNKLYDPQITAMLPAFRKFVGDDGAVQTASTLINLDSGAGSGLLQPDGSTTTFNLADIPDTVPAIVLEGSVTVVKNSLTLVNNTDYYVNYDAGQVVFVTAPAANDTITITYTEVAYTNRVLNAALSNAIERLAGLGINGYGISYDNNVVLSTSTLNNNGLRFIIFLTAQKILNQAVIWAKARAARAYKTGDFSMDSAPSRILDGMSKQSDSDFLELKAAVNNYIKTNTFSFSFGEFDSFMAISGLFPSWSAMWIIGFPFWV